MPHYYENVPFRAVDIDGDFRRDPKTHRYCCRCQKDLKPGQKRRLVHLVITCAALHPDDEAAYAAASPAERGTDYGWFLIGADCAKIIGLDYSLDPSDPRVAAEAAKWDAKP